MATRPSALTTPGRRTLALLAGDIVVFLVFAAIGRRSHGEAAGLGALLDVAVTAAPFILGWMAAAPWLGAFSPEATRGPAAMLRVTLASWLAALAVGAVARALFIGRFSPPSFYVVTFLVALLLLGGWRGLFAWVESRRSR
jgi:hypothetical protein